MIRLVRCDDRLIHGQCMTAIVTHYNIRSILIVDDGIAGNALLKSIFEKAVPSNMTATVHTLETAAPLARAAVSSGENILLLVGNPKIFPPLFEAVPGLPRSVNIGPMSKRKDTREAVVGTYLAPDEVAALEQLDAQGIEIVFNAVPEGPKASFRSVRSKL